MSHLAAILDPSRSAHASIHGYLYQAYLGVERWLELPKNVVLRCEGDEDLDQLFRDGSGGLSIQVKALTGTVNIRDQVVQETLRRFAVSHHRLRAAGDDRTFLFTSTATRRTQRLDDHHPVDVLAVWEEARRDDEVRARVVEVLRAILPGDAPDQPLREALAWLEAGNWADLIRSIEWQLGEPQLDEVRKRIKAKLNKLLPSVPPGLDHRLLGRVLDASIAPEPKGRCLTSAELTKITRKAQTEVTRWLKTSEGRGLVERLDELDNLRGVLYDKALELPPAPRPSKLLIAAYEVIPFDETGRTEILDDLARWCDDDRKRLVRLIHGDGGLGKTRLLIECCRRLAAQGWVTGFVEPTLKDHELPKLLEGTLPRLLVIDYAETRLDAVRTLVSRLAHLKDGPRARLVLLARREGDWWRTLKTDAATEDLLESTRPQKLSEFLPGLAERRQAFQTVAQAFAQHLSSHLHPPAKGPFPLGGGGLEKGEGQDGGGPRQGNLPDPDLTDDAFGRPLYLHMAALAAVQGHPVTLPADALAETLKRERRYWQGEVQDLDSSLRLELDDALPTAVTALTLLGGLETEPKTRDLAQHLLPAEPAKAKHLTRLLHRLYSAPPDSGRHLEGLEPDLLGEELVWEELRQNRRALHLALDLADPTGSKQLLTVLTRLAQRPERSAEVEAWLREAFEAKLEDLAEPALEVAVTLGDPVGLLLAQVIQEQASPELAERVMKRCDGEDLQQSVSLREVALHSTQRVYDELRAQREQNAADTNTATAQGRLALAASNLGTRLSALGRREEALQATQEAADLYRLLVRQRPDVFRPDLARSLSNLGTMLRDLGRREEALQATQEATDLFRLLVRQRSDAFCPDLARSLNNLGTMVSGLGRREDALQATQEAVKIQRLTAQQRPGTLNPGLATSLNNLGETLSALGRHEEALQATQEAVEIWHIHAQQRPDAFRTDLADSLNNLGIRLHALGRCEEALQATRDAADLHRLLAEQRPDIFRPNLARCLHNLGIMLSALGHHEEALHTAQEAVEIRRILAQQHPDAFRPDLARSLINLGGDLSTLGHREEALKATQEAADLYRLLAQQRPDVFRPELAPSLSNLGIMLSKLHRGEEALKATLEAVEIRRLLTQQRPDAFMPGLAQSLNTLGAVLSGLGRREEALQATQEAADLFRLLFHQRPNAFRPNLAESLYKLGERLGDLGRREEALQAALEAVDLCRLMAHQRPDAFRANLATSLNDLGIRLNACGRREEALEATQEAVDLCRLMAQQRPDAFRSDFATSLNDLGVRLSALGRREEALQATQEAVDLCRLMAQQQPEASKPDLARSLNNLGGCLSALGRREEALQALQEAVKIRRLLADQRPDAFRPDLAMSLGNLSHELSAAGHVEAALEAAEEGVRMLAPFFLRWPQAIKVWMASLFCSYWKLCEETSREPDLELLEPVVEALASLPEETS